jgi:polysaccharide export outer membrane protein
VDVANADISGLVLTRDGRNYVIDLDAINRDGVAQDIYLKSGDRLFLPYNDRKEVYVVGEAEQPQAIPFKTTDMTLTQALGRAGGLDPVSSKGSAVYVIRGMDDKGNPAAVFNLDATSPAAFAVASRFNLRAGDVVWVGPAGITRWNRYITQLLPFSGLIRNAAAGLPWSSMPRITYTALPFEEVGSRPPARPSACVSVRSVVLNVIACGSFASPTT